MKRTAYLGFSLLLLIALLAAPPAFGQDKPKQAKTPAEYNAYLAFYNEKDPAKKAELGEKFVNDFKESDFVTDAYLGTLTAYSNAKNWRKVIDTAEKAVALPNADNKLKAAAYFNAMVAAQNLNDVDKVIGYGEKVLTIDATDLNALVTLSAVIPAKLPAGDAEKKTALDKADNYANKALSGVQGLLAKADAATKAQLVPIEGNLLATKGLIAYNRMDYMKSIEEYEQALQRTPKDDVARFYLALDYQALAAQSSRQYTAAVDDENKAKRERAEQPVIDELAAKSAGLAEDVRKYRDKAIEEFANAAALGGPVAMQAKTALETMWKAKNNDSLAGMDEYIAERKKQFQD